VFTAMRIGMKLLVDTDAFCKLSMIGLLQDAIDILEVDITDCGKLAPLPYMLKKGKLRKTYGAAKCDDMLQIADGMPIMVQAADSWRDKLIPVQAIDTGEAQIFAAAAETGLLVITGDKRAIRALKNLNDFVVALAGRIIVLEAILIALCDQIGSDEVRKRAQVLIAHDKMFQNCFSPGTPDPLW